MRDGVDHTVIVGDTRRETGARTVTLISFSQLKGVTLLHSVHLQTLAPKLISRTAIVSFLLGSACSEHSFLYEPHLQFKDPVRGSLPAVALFTPSYSSDHFSLPVPITYT